MRGKNCKRISGECTEVPKELEVTPWEEVLPGVCPIRLGHLHTESSTSTQISKSVKDVEVY